MIAVTPWAEFVACRDLHGMLLQVRRTKRQGDLWGEIREISYDGHELVVGLSWTTVGDPKKRGSVKTVAVEPVRLLPQAEGPLYTEDDVAFSLRDLHTGCECFIRHAKIGRPTRGQRAAGTVTR